MTLSFPKWAFLEFPHLALTDDEPGFLVHIRLHPDFDASMLEIEVDAYGVLLCSDGVPDQQFTRFRSVLTFPERVDPTRARFEYVDDEIRIRLPRAS